MSEPSQDHYLQHIPAGCLVFNLDAAITFVNDTLCQIVGYNSEELVGHKVEKILSISSRIFYQTHLFPLLRLQGEVKEIFLSLKGKEGVSVPVMLNAKADSHEGVTTYLCILVVVAERQKYEQQLIATQKAQQKLLEEKQMLNELKSQLELNQYELDRKVRAYKQFTEDLAQVGKALTHDMQEPIRKISFFANSLIEKNGISEPSPRILEIIHRSAGRLRKLTNTLLDYVSVEALEEPVTMLSLRDFAEWAKVEARKETNFDDFEVEIFDDIVFEGRRKAIQRVFTELFANAIKNRDTSRKLVISIRAITLKENAYQINQDKYRYTDHVQIEVADNGLGFNMQYASYIFGLLNKLDASTTGVGLGLAMCRQLVSYHFGKINATSVPGQGATFTIQLPVSQTE